MNDSDELPIATRAWMRRAGSETGKKTRPRIGSQPVERWRNSVLIFDTETTTDPTQRLTFGCYRFGSWRSDGILMVAEEGLFCADSLPSDDPEGFALLEAYAAQHEPETSGFHRTRRLMLRSQREFLDTVFWHALRQDALIVGFNLPFDLSRLACGVAPARGTHQGGFSFRLWEYVDPETGERKEHQYRPRVRVTQIDSKRSRMDITQPKGRPQGLDGKPIVYRPGFLDTRTLACALTDRGHSLRSACEAFGVEQGKGDASEHGRITTDYIAYARQDVKATGLLLDALRVEYDRHPIDLDPCRAYSPASIAKAYYRAMGITPRLQKQPDFPAESLGHCMSAYYGGRAECAIRRTPVPIVYTDVLSMYPSVNANMGLWPFHVAERVETRDCTDDVRALLDTVTPELLCDPETWMRLRFYAQIVPDGDVLPVRAQYSGTGGTFNIGVNPFHGDQPHWYAGPDLVASVLLTGKVPKVLEAFELVAIGSQSTLRPVALRDTVTVDPAAGDFFRTVIEERKRAPKTDRLNSFLKVLANSGSYGVFVESNPEELKDGEAVSVMVYGPDSTPFPAKASRPETPGTYSFPPVAALITAGARLVLALIERMVTHAGGSHAFCDTDSMAIVATETGGLVPCEGGDHRLPDGRAAIRALSWAEVERIVADLEPLNPYSREVVPGSLLEVEDVNVDAATGARRQVWCVSIAAKRYALFTKDERGEPIIVPGTTRHGLGFLIDPRDSSDDAVKRLAPWEHALWEGIVRELLGFPFDSPPWRDRPAVMRHTVSSPHLLKAFEQLNRGKGYVEQIKPFNFMLAVPVEAQGRPDGLTADAPLTLMAPYEANPRRWVLRNWYDVYTDDAYRITTRMPGGGAGTVGVKALGTVASAYPFHPEAKRCGPNGTPCGKHTSGVLLRRPVHAAGLVCIGKEAHRLEERDLASGLEELQSVHADPQRDPWVIRLLPRLRSLAGQPGGRKAMLEASGLQPRALRDILSGRSRSRSASRAALTTLVQGATASAYRRYPICDEPIAMPDPRRQYCSTRCRERSKQQRRGSTRGKRKSM